MSQEHQKPLETHLIEALGRLEKAYKEILKTQPYGRETEKMRLLIEIVKEQVPNENSHHSAGETW